MKRIIVFGLVAATVVTAENIWLATSQPQISSGLAVHQVNGGATAAADLRAFELVKNSAHVLGGCLVLLAALVCFAPWIKAAGLAVWRALGHTTLGRFLSSAVLPALLAGLLTSGCMREYDRP